MGCIEDKLQSERDQRERWDRFCAAMIVEERQLDGLALEAKRVAAVTLTAAGYHQHARGVWRKKRRGLTVTQTMTTELEEQTRLINDRIQRAGESEDAARTYFEEFTRVGPEWEGQLIAVHRGDLVRENEDALIRRMSGDDHLKREAIRHRLAQLRRDLIGPEPCSAVERIIVDRAVIAWLSVQEAEARLIRFDNPKLSQGFYQKRFDHAQSRLLGVLKALDQVRRKTVASHRLSVKVLGDVHLGGSPPGLTVSLQPTIELTDHTAIHLEPSSS